MLQPTSVGLLDSRYAWHDFSNSLDVAFGDNELSVAIFGDQLNETSADRSFLAVRPFVQQPAAATADTIHYISSHASLSVSYNFDLQIYHRY